MAATHDEIQASFGRGLVFALSQVDVLINGFRGADFLGVGLLIGGLWIADCVSRRTGMLARLGEVWPL